MNYRWQELGYDSYREYLNSRHWQNVQLGMVALFGDSCEFCGSQEPLNIHHFTYETLGDESIDDLAVLCRGCHQDAHDFERIGEQIHRFILNRRESWEEGDQHPIESSRMYV